MTGESGGLRELYQEVIVDHSKRPRNFKRLEGPECRRAEGVNPLCGDHITVYAEMDSGRLKNVSFEGAGCAISVASASMMTEALKNKSEAEAEAIFQKFHHLITGTAEMNDASGPELGKLEVFSGVCEFPARVKCASLAWHTLHTVLKAPTSGAVVSTEENGGEAGG